ncbi:MAG: Do family serine endopeptidase [Planctomycetaceae bacterium]
MRFARDHRNWLLAIVASSGLAVAAGMSFRDSVIADQTVGKAPIGHGRSMTTAFRDVTKEALPAIVSIETRGKQVELTSGAAAPFGEDSPFREFFGDDPRLKEFFERMPKERQTPRQVPRSRGMGSGFVIDESGVIMTNSHVVRDAEEVKVTLHDGREFIGTDIKHDPFSDVAIVRIGKVEGLKALPLGDSDRMEIGDWVLAVGNPFGLRGTVTAGIISAKGRGPGIAQREDFLQTDAAINPGNSGGPLLNLDGEVIGLNTAISSRGGGNDGVGFAIPINMAKWVARQLIDDGAVQRAFLGVSIQPVDSKLAKQFGVSVGEGAIVSNVMPDSPAANAELRPGDVIVRVNGHDVRGPRGLQNVVEQLEVGKSYDLVVLRDGDRRTIPVTLGDMPERLALAGRDDHADSGSESTPPADEFSEIGLEVQDVAPEVAKQLGFEADVQGVLVSDVKANGPAHEAGIRAGQIIEKVGSRSVASAKEFRQAIEGLSLEDGILMLVRSTEGARFVVVQ